MGQMYYAGVLRYWVAQRAHSGRKQRNENERKKPTEQTYYIRLWNSLCQPAVKRFNNV